MLKSVLPSGPRTGWIVRPAFRSAPLTSPPESRTISSEGSFEGPHFSTAPLSGWIKLLDTTGPTLQRDSGTLRDPISPGQDKMESGWGRKKPSNVLDGIPASVKLGGNDNSCRFFCHDQGKTPFYKTRGMTKRGGQLHDLEQERAFKSLVVAFLCRSVMIE
jgi:hypothetical protein